MIPFLCYTIERLYDYPTCNGEVYEDLCYSPW